MTLTIVKKFGGSSVADVGRIAKVADVVVAAHQRGERVVVVVSAMGKTTDQLIKLAHEVSPEPDRRELDMLLTAGERISMALLAMAIRDRGVAATSLTGSQCGIMTNARQGSARIVEVRPFRVEDALDDGHIAIVAGFQGVSYRREVTTLGRGGSDTTAVALAAALGADACEIYSDVDGVYTADPKVVLEAKRLDSLSYDEMLELARAGAKVLAEDCVAWAKAHGVALYVKAADGQGGETMVRRDEPQGLAQVAGVASRPEALLWEFSGMARLLGPLRDALAQAGIAPLLELCHGDSVTLVLARDIADSAGAGFAALQARGRALLGEDLRREVQGTLVSAVGSALAREPALGGRFDAVVDDVLGPDDAASLPRFAHGLCRSTFCPPAQASALTLALHAALLAAPDATASTGQGAPR